MAFAQPDTSANPLTGNPAAIDAATGKVVWKFSVIHPSLSAGVGGTRGALVFAATAEGEFVAPDEETGKPLWHFRTGVPVASSPISYGAGGHQFVAVTAGNMVYSFALPE